MYVPKRWCVDEAIFGLSTAFDRPCLLFKTFFTMGSPLVLCAEIGEVFATEAMK